MLTSGRKKSVQDAPTANDHDCTDAKPTKRSFKGKYDSAFRAIVRFWKGWWSGNGRCDNSSGSRPNFFGDSTSPLTRGGKNVVQSEGGLAIPPF